MKKIKKKLFIALLLFLMHFDFSYAGLNENINSASTDISNFFENIEKDTILIVTGSKISIEEKMLFNLIKSNIADLQGIEIINDKYELESQEKYKNKNLVLIGSEKTNLATKYIKDKLNNENKEITNENIRNYSPLNIAFYELDDKKILVAYAEKEDKNTDNNIIEKSPLSNFIDKKHVPVIASFLSILFLYLWNVLIKTGIEFSSDFISSKLLQKITSKKKSKKKDIENLRLRQFIEKSEIIAFFLYTILFSIVISYGWSNNLNEFLKLFFINIMVVGSITFIREFARQYYCFKDKINSEFAFWPFGSILTLISTFLGNTFSLACYTLVDEEHEKKFGKVSFFISLYTFIIAIITYIINTLSPSLVIQMIFVYSLLVLFIDLLPMSPMAGRDIIKWKFIPWLLIYLIVFACYIYINFSAYVFYV